MLQATTLGAKGSALAGSLLVHAAVVVALGGHADSARVAPSKPPLLVEVSAFEAPPDVVAVDAPKAAVPARRVAPPSHTHRYPVAHQHDATPHDPRLVHAPVSVSPAPAARPTFALSLAPPSVPSAPRFAIDVGSAPRASASRLAGAGAPGALDGEPVAEAGVDTKARLLQGATPFYPRAAAEADIERDVPLELVVDAKGRVQSARVLKQVGYGLEAASLNAVRAYRFSPAILRGRPTPVRMKWTMVFRLQ